MHVRIDYNSNTCGWVAVGLLPEWEWVGVGHHEGEFKIDEQIN